ncbi:hypothetical protein SprV_0501947200 [Sparganum proliferum]
MQDAWMARKTKKTQGYADRKEWKNFFSTIRAVYSPTAKGIAPLVGADGSTLLSEKTFGFKKSRRISRTPQPSGISLLNISGNIFVRILLNRLNHHLEQGLLPESQCGFCRHRGTTDMIFAARQLQEKCQEMRTHLYSTFVDLTKAFDTVNREGL